tara:strand:- start:821 stop:1006 length:186 start_codon:yes stop_codon:yes gene_type:complete
MREAVDGRRSLLGVSHPRTIESLEAVIEFHDAWHQAEPDAGHDAKAEAYRSQLDAIKAQRE